MTDPEHEQQREPCTIILFAIALMVIVDIVWCDLRRWVKRWV